MVGGFYSKFSNFCSNNRELREIFATHGLPEVLVSDNGTAFSSTEFQEFTKRNSIRHIRTAPYHPSSNGQVERAVQIFKDAMKKHSSESIQTRVSRFLFHYRTTPHTTTGVCPSELLMGRRLRTHLCSLIPETTSTVARKQEIQKANYDKNTKNKILVEGDTVLARDFSSVKSKWVAGRLNNNTGPMSYEVELEDGRVVRRHLNHIKPYAGLTEWDERKRYSDAESIEVNSREGYQEQDNYKLPEVVPTFQEHEPSLQGEVPELHRSQRLRHPPKRYEPEL